jgi:hypothetical protein
MDTGAALDFVFRSLTDTTLASRVVSCGREPAPRLTNGEL